jgi:hypothetical protein
MLAGILERRLALAWPGLAANETSSFRSKSSKQPAGVQRANGAATPGSPSPIVTAILSPAKH